MKRHKVIKIVLTGAPSSGKSSTLEALKKQYASSFVLVPESAVILLSGGFPAPDHSDLEQIRAFQKAIIPVQENLEMMFERKYPDAYCMVFDRAKLDGAAFWPLGPEDYLKTFNIDKAKELKSYDYVVFMDLPSQEHFGGVHQERFHNYEQSAKCGKVLEEVWSVHPSFVKIPAYDNFNKKVEHAVDVITQLLI